MALLYFSLTFCFFLVNMLIVLSLDQHEFDFAYLASCGPVLISLSHELAAESIQTHICKFQKPKSKSKTLQNTVKMAANLVSIENS